ncbi:MAG: hypothetical protein RI967_1494, partial [Planctomycetota bacterium]
MSITLRACARLLFACALAAPLPFPTTLAGVPADPSADPSANPSAWTLDATREAIAAANERLARAARTVHDPLGERGWIDGSRLWFESRERDGARRWWLADAGSDAGSASNAGGEPLARRPLFDHEALAAHLGVGDPSRLPIRGVAVEGGSVAVGVEGRDEPVVLALGGGVVEGADLATMRALLETELLPGKRRSRGQGASSGLVFVNALDEPVELVWVDSGGGERGYGLVEPGAERRQHTYGGHAWLVKTASGERLGHVVAGEVERTVRIAGRARRRPDAIDGADGQRETAGDGARDDADGSSAMPSYEVVNDGPELVVRAGGVEVFRTSGSDDRDGFTGGRWISPARDAIVAMKVRRGERHPVHIVEAAPKDRLEPKLRTLDYTKPGDEIDRPVPHLFRVEADAGASAGLRVREVSVDPALVANPWSIDRVRFLPGGREAAFLFNQRGHQVVRLVGLDLESGAMRTIAEESFPTFVDYTNKIWMHWLDATGELLWMTERDGWNHLVLVEVATGAVKRRVTEGPWLVRRVEHVDAEARAVDLAVMGRDPAQDPYHVHFARVSIDTGAITMLTAGDGTCRADFSPDRSTLLVTRARADLPPVHELRRASDGALVATLAEAAIAGPDAFVPPERFVAKGRDGVTDIWGLVHRPSGFDPTRKYPVIEMIYAGPHGQHVPKWFETRGRAREYAELGAIVVQIDGMGTNWRSKAFHDVCWKNLADAGFPDRIAWIRALAAKDPSLDLSRVGIFGGSAGGQNAMRALIDHGDFYRVAVADCGCHDNRMDKIWWNEQWMGWPVDESYEKSSNMVHAHRTAGDLMLVVGALDENVDPATTLQVAQRLVEAGKDFELLVIPDGGHGAAESPYGNA